MYAIAGATGNTGRIVAETLLAKGAGVRAWVRSADKGASLAAKGAELAIVDLDDPSSIRAGLEGVSGAYVLLPPPDVSRGAFLESRAALAERLTAAIAEAKLAHVVLLSSVGAQHPEGTGVIRSLHDMEARLTKAGVASTFLRAAYFLQNWASVLDAAKGDGVLPQMLGDANRPIPMVSTDDIGRVAAEALLEGPSSAGVIELEGPRDYAPSDVAVALAGELGRPVQPVDVPFEAQTATLASFGMSENVAGLFAEMNRGIAAGHVDFEGVGRRRRGAVTLEEAVRRML